MLPDFFDENKVGEIYQVPYQTRAEQAKSWSLKKGKGPKTAVLLIDVQNTFCIPSGELYVNGAVEDNIRLCRFIYNNLQYIDKFFVTLDTHNSLSIFHPRFWVDKNGNNPEPFTIISFEDFKNGKWQVADFVTREIYRDAKELNDYVFEYLEQLESNSKYQLSIWPYHSMLGGVGHAIVPAIEEAMFFQNLCMKTSTKFIVKGDNPLTESYSAFLP